MLGLSGEFHYLKILGKRFHSSVVFLYYIPEEVCCVTFLFTFTLASTVSYEVEQRTL